MLGNQLLLSLPGLRPPRTWGGARVGAGRKPIKESERRRVPHRARPVHRARHPVHVTLRARGGLPSFREQTIFAEMQSAIRGASRSPAVGAAFRVLHFSVQSNHVHLVIEAHDESVLSRGMLGLNVRLARAVNRVLRVRGRVWGERYHGHALRTPREVRNALVYVLMNVKKHAPRFRGLDPCSSAAWFDGFVDEKHGPGPPEERPIALARTWLASSGWRARGLLRVDERPFVRAR